ncbi:MAG: lasso peptide biosynthesis B2 protein [Acidobacteria bacterium]|nr:lasso peptide biosynthesis B2 protein [Acidobacteriota bacterium]
MTIQALVVFVLLDIGFRVCGFPRVFQFVGRRGWRSVEPAPLAVQRRRLDRTLEAVRTASRYYHRRGLDCLPRSLAIYVLLRRQGVPATLRIGVKRFPFAAHAWVECLGEVFDDSIDDWRHEPYVPILSTGEPL